MCIWHGEALDINHAATVTNITTAAAAIIEEQERAPMSRAVKDRASNKVAAITNIEFPKTLAALEAWLGITGFLQSKILHCAKIVDPLQQRKTGLLKRVPS